MHTAKILSAIVGGLIALIALVLLAVWLFVDPNHYKDRITAAVKDATGRELVLQGDIKLSVFPWISLELGPASLGNPPGFGTQPFVSFTHASFRAKLLPLLAKRLQIGRIELDGLDARLIKNADGKGNWEGFGKAAAQTPAPKATSTEKPDDQESGATLFGGIAGVKITHSRVSYNQFVLENLDFETGSLAAKELAPVTLHVDANRGVATEHASIDAKFNFSGDFAQGIYHIAALTFHGTVNQADNPRAIRWDFTAPEMDLDLKGQTVAAPAFGFNLDGALVSGSLKGSTIVDAPSVSGKVSLAPVVLREYLPRLGITLPRTRDAKALSSLSASSSFAYGDNAAKLEDLQIVLDDTHLKGSAGIVNLETDAIKFALAVDGINLDRYLAPEGTPPAPTPAPTPAAAPEKSTPLEANGTLTVGSVHLAPLDLTAVNVTVAATGGVIHLYPLTAQIDGGQYSGNITLDSHGKVPTLSMDEHLTGIEVGQLVSTGSKNIHVSGRGNVSIKATAQGAEADAVKKSLNGHFDMMVNNGAVEGVDVGFQLGRAEAVIRRQDIPNTPDSKRTQFDALKMTADITNGVATTKDLIISSPVLKVTGQGSANLATMGIDFSLLADTLRTAGNTPIQVPIKVTGTAADPTVRPDLEALAKGQLKQKVQDVLQDKLKGLFNR